MDRPFYSITINGKNTWDEWALMPVKAGKIEFATAELRYDSAEVAGSDDVLDFTEALTGYPLYNQRRGSITFRFFDNGTPVRNRFDQLKSAIHGKKAKAIIEDQPEYFYEGRFMVGNLTYASRGNWAEVEISYLLNAYKLEMTSSAEDWLWNPFNFETGVIREYNNLSVEGLLDVTVIGSAKPTVPRFIVNAETSITLTFGNTIYPLSEGVNVVPTVLLLDQEYTMRFTGLGTVSIDMTAGAL